MMIPDHPVYAGRIEEWRNAAAVYGHGRSQFMSHVLDIHAIYCLQCTAARARMSREKSMNEKVTGTSVNNNVTGMSLNEKVTGTSVNEKVTGMAVNDNVTGDKATIQISSPDEHSYCNQRYIAEDEENDLTGIPSLERVTGPLTSDQTSKAPPKPELNTMKPKKKQMISILSDRHMQIKPSSDKHMPIKPIADKHIPNTPTNRYIGNNGNGSTDTQLQVKENQTLFSLSRSQPIPVISSKDSRKPEARNNIHVLTDVEYYVLKHIDKQTPATPQNNICVHEQSSKSMKTTSDKPPGSPRYGFPIQSEQPHVDGSTVVINDTVDYAIADDAISTVEVIEPPSKITSKTVKSIGDGSTRVIDHAADVILDVSNIDTVHDVHVSPSKFTNRYVHSLLDNANTNVTSTVTHTSGKSTVDTVGEVSQCASTLLVVDLNTLAKQETGKTYTCVYTSETAAGNKTPQMILVRPPEESTAVNNEASTTAPMLTHQKSSETGVSPHKILTNRIGYSNEIIQLDAQAKYVFQQKAVIDTVNEKHAHSIIEPVNYTDNFIEVAMASLNDETGNTYTCSDVTSQMATVSTAPYIKYTRPSRKVSSMKQVLKSMAVKFPQTVACPHCQKSFANKQYLDKHLPQHNNVDDGHSTNDVNIQESLPTIVHNEGTSDVATGDYTPEIMSADANYANEGTAGVGDADNTPEMGYIDATGNPSAVNDGNVINSRLVPKIPWYRRPGLSVTCPHCQKAFRNKDNLRKHLLLHDKDSKFACDVCGKTHSCKDHLLQHMHKHTNFKPYACTLCQKRFAYPGSLKDHMNVHLGIKDLKCSRCGELFVARYQLKNHLWKIHNVPSRRKKTYDKPKTMVCEYCGLVFSSKVSLNSHYDKHEEVPKSDVCFVCGKTFACRSSLSMHTAACHKPRAKYPKKPGVCCICGTKFKNYSSVQKHMKRFHNDVIK